MSVARFGKSRYLILQHPGAFGIVSVAPGQDFVGRDFDETKTGVVVAEVPFVFVVEVVGDGVYDLPVGDVGLAFDEEDVLGVGQGKGDHLVVDEVLEFLGVRGGAEIDTAV